VPDAGLPIAEVAQRTGLSKDTLRYYYEKAGLNRGRRPVLGGQRRYATTDLDWLAFLSACARPACPSPTCNGSPNSVAKAAPASTDRLACSPATATPVQRHIADLQGDLQVLNTKIAHYQTCSISRPERTTMTTNTHSRHVSEQHLLGPAVEQARYDRGAQVLAAVDGEGGQSVVDALADIAPALAHHVVAYAFGTSTRARPHTCATPAHHPRHAHALGGCEAQLEVHVNASLNVG